MDGKRSFADAERKLENSDPAFNKIKIGLLKAWTRDGYVFNQFKLAKPCSWQIFFIPLPGHCNGGCRGTQSYLLPGIFAAQQ